MLNDRITLTKLQYRLLLATHIRDSNLSKNTRNVGGCKSPCQTCRTERHEAYNVICSKKDPQLKPQFMIKLLLSQDKLISLLFICLFQIQK